MRKDIKEEYQQLRLQRDKELYPTIPDHCRAVSVPKINSANSLTKAIKQFITLNGDQCERVSTTGRYVDDSKTFIDVIGRYVKVGSGKWIKGSGRKGSADLHSTIKKGKYGISVKWEVKWGKDTQKPNQKEYQREVEQAGGLYYIVRDFEQFYDIYKTLKNDET